jgi:hypothetical protein
MLTRAILASALLALPLPAVAATDSENFAKVIAKFLSPDPDNPRKGLCVCTADHLTLSVLKRVGFMTPGGYNQFRAVNCILPEFDGSGARIVGPTIECSDWVPLAR